MLVSFPKLRIYRLLNFRLHSVIDVVNAFVTDERLHKAVVELAEKANFVSAITTLITSDRFDIIRSKIYGNRFIKKYITGKMKRFRLYEVYIATNFLASTTLLITLAE